MTDISRSGTRRRRSGTRTKSRKGGRGRSNGHPWRVGCPRPRQDGERRLGAGGRGREQLEAMFVVKILWVGLRKGGDVLWEEGV